MALIHIQDYCAVVNGNHNNETDHTLHCISMCLQFSNYNPVLIVAVKYFPSHECSLARPPDRMSYSVCILLYF